MHAANRMNRTDSHVAITTNKAVAGGTERTVSENYNESDERKNIIISARSLMEKYIFGEFAALIIQASAFFIFSIILIISGINHPASSVGQTVGVIFLVLCFSAVLGYLASQCYRRRKYSQGLCITIQILLIPVGISLFEAQHRILGTILCASIIVLLGGMLLRALQLMRSQDTENRRQ